MFDIKENLKELPDKPGVYLHKDKLGQVIYVGKASSLKNRVRQYFQSSRNMDAKVRAMVSHIEEFEYITTATEMEALILECTLIKKNIYEAIDFLNGKSKPLTDYLKMKMKEEADKLNYEGAAEYRDYINAINSLNQKQNVVILGAKDMDVITILKGEKEYYAVLFFVREGKLSGRETYHLQTNAEDEPCEMTRAFIEQYYTEVPQIPNEILIQYEIEDKPLVEEFLTTISGKRIKITMPVRGEKKAMLELVKKDVIEMGKSIDAKALNQRERETSIRKEMEGLINEYNGFTI